MNIVFLDAKTIGEDIDLSGYDKLGTVIKYGFSTTEEARERTKDADVVIVNKVQINETSIGEAEHLKLVCVTATGTNNLDKAYLDAHYKWQDDLSQDDLLSSTQMLSYCEAHLDKCCRIFHGDGGTAHICPVILSLGKIKIL